MAQSLSGGGTVYEDDDDTDGEDNTVLEGNLDLEAMGLTKDDLRRLVLASYVTQSTVDTELGIEITEEERDHIIIERDGKYYLNIKTSGNQLAVMRKTRYVNLEDSFE